MHTFGLLPAAGLSRRMGEPKLLLPVAGKTVLEHAVAALHQAGIEQILVVVAPHAEALAHLASTAGTSVLRLSQDTPDMRATCQQGLDWIETHWQPHFDDGWLLLPADHPTLRSDVVIALLAGAQALSDRTIVVPVHRGRRGHPTWLRWSHAAAICHLQPDEGLNYYIRRHAQVTQELEWAGDDILRDLDTPEDYQRLLSEWE